jgi:hypothetical protein
MGAAMRLGLLADIHEEADLLCRAIEALKSQGVSRFVILGDIFETGKALEKTSEILSRLDSEGVWGNHDFGLCRDVEEWVRREKARVFRGCNPHPATGSLRPEAIGAAVEVTKPPEPSMQRAVERPRDRTGRNE